MSAAESTVFGQDDQRYLLDLARKSIEHGFRENRALLPEACPPHLSAPAACFVTLRRASALRGCIGNLKPRYPLTEAVARNAYSAAFSDPRFPALEMQECSDLEVQISVLSAPEPLAFIDETDLLAQLQPGRHGLIIEAGDRQATFLPSVWLQIPERGAFLRQLKVKAGIEPALPVNQLAAWRYSTATFPADP